MRLLVTGITALLLVLVATPTASAYSDPFAPLAPLTDPVYEELRPVCAQVLQDMRDNGTVGDHSDHEGYGYELEWWSKAPECAELRDELQWQYNVYGAIPYTEQCYGFQGVNCVAVNHDACDFALIIMSGVLYYCLGGLNPEN